MEELIKVATDGQGSSVVSARELHCFLDVKSRFNDWIKNRIIKYGFVEDRDYVALTKNLVGGGIETDYALTLDMAKELSMVERNEKGKQARQYFIQCEETLRQVAQQQAAPPVQLSTEQMLLQLASQQTQLLTNQQEQLDRLRAEVDQIKATGQRPSRPDHVRPGQARLGQQLRLPGTGPAAYQQPELRQLINRRIDDYCDRFGYERRDTWTYLYKRLFEVYGINTHRLVKGPRESLLDVLERYGHLDRLYSLIIAELAYTDE